MKFSNEHIPVVEGISFKQDFQYKEFEKLYCRDPYIMPYDGKYYLYLGAGQRGIICQVSEDLKTWSGWIDVFTPPENFHGIDSWFWAPECHYYNGKFYIFTSVKSSTCGHRVISSYVSDNPLGPFEEIGIISPLDWDSIDGTLYIDEENQPWLVFVHEWTSMPEPDKIGAISCAKLNNDLSGFISEPKDLFYATDPEWARNRVTDGPFMYRTDNQKLLMIWSNFSPNGYVVAVASSTNGKVDGEWVQERLLFDEDGGHAMIFKTFEGDVMLALHTPNMLKTKTNIEHLLLLELKEENDMLYLK